jgi:hypothetical protein
MKRWLVALLLVAALWALLLWTPWAKPAPVVVPQLEPAAAPTAPAQPHDPAPVLSAEPTPLAAPQPQAEPPEAPAPAVHSTRLPQIMDMPPPQAQGPFRALKQRFGSESASDASRANEAKVKATFMHFNPPPELLEDIVCRRSVCRITTRWRPERALAFTIGLNELRRDFDPNLGIDQPGPPDAERFQRIEVYLDLASPRPPLP